MAMTFNGWLESKFESTSSARANGAAAENSQQTREHPAFRQLHRLFGMTKAGCCGKAKVKCRNPEVERKNWNQFGFEPRTDGVPKTIGTDRTAVPQSLFCPQSQISRFRYFRPLNIAKTVSLSEASDKA